MTIPTDRLNQNFIVVESSRTLAYLHDRVKATGNNWTYIVVRLPGNKYAVLRLTDLIGVLQKTPESLYSLWDAPLLSVQLTRELLESCAAQPIDQSEVSYEQARRLVNSTRRKRASVLAGDTVVGVLAIESRSIDTNVDPDWLDKMSELYYPPVSVSLPAPSMPEPVAIPPPMPQPARRMPPPPMQQPTSRPGPMQWLSRRLNRIRPQPSPPPSPPLPNLPRMQPPQSAQPPKPKPTRSWPPETRTEKGTGALTLGRPPETVAPPLPKSEAELEKRWINAEILDHEPSAPLEVGERYTLAFDVDTEVRPTSIVKDADFRYSYKDEEESVDLTVQLSSNDFEIYSEPQKLRVPRQGKSKNRARFDIEPKHSGAGVVNAVFLKDGNFIQLLTITLNAGERQRLSAESMTRPLDAAFDVQPRDLGLIIRYEGNGFTVILTGPVYAEAKLPITVPELNQLIGQARKALRQVVYLEAGANKTRVYQTGFEIAPDVNRFALVHLAEAGFLLFRQIFYGDAADAQANLLGDRLIEISQKQRLKLQIVSQQFLLPWGVLYLADDFDGNQIDPERFLGLKHIIEHIPLQPNMQVVDPAINSQPNLTVSVNVNPEIDQQMKKPLIADQLNYWNKISQRGGAKVIVRQTGEEVELALANPDAAEQLLYFYCHAVSKTLGEDEGPDASALGLSGKSLTLRDLKLRAPAKKGFPGSPLVFINACESAELSPLFYGGFVPYFMSKGARGVIGTEAETPAVFAREWARRFFDSFLAGKPLGKTFLDLRREFYYQHNNVMGLLYAIYCDGDTQVIPGLNVGQT